MQWWIMHTKTRDNYIYEGNTFQGHVEVPGGLIMWNLTEEVFGALGSVLMSGVSKLVSLSVAENDVRDAGAKHMRWDTNTANYSTWSELNHHIHALCSN